MSKQTIPSTLALVGSVLVGQLSAADLASATDDPFQTKALETGYAQIATADDEGKCGSDKDGEGKCGEGKCGEGQCGSKN